MTLNKAGALASIALLCASSQALAQTSPSPIVPSNRPDQAPVTSSPTQDMPPQAQAAQPLPDITPFQLQRVEISGSSLSPAVLQAAWAPFVGETVDSSRLVEVSDAVIAAYARSDVALYTVLVPNQDFAGGVLQINVLEGYVENVSIQGTTDPKVQGLVRRYLDVVKRERPLTKTTLQRYASLTRDLPGVRSELQFVTGSATEAVGLVADVDTNPVQVAVAVNNRGAAFLGRTQVAADLYLNNLVPGGQSRVTYVTPTDTRLFQYYSVGHSQLLGVSGATLQVNAGHLRTRPRTSDLVGEATSAGVQLTYPVIRSFEEDLYVTAGLDGLNANSAFLGSTFSDDRSRAARFSVLYGRQNARRRLTLSGAVSFGLDTLGARTLLPDTTELSYVKLNGRASFATQLGERIVLRLAAAGQLSDDRLPAAEQFALGGNEFGRGYESAALIGDQGYAGSAELAYRPPGFPAFIRDAEGYGFLDGGSNTYNGRAGLPSIDEDLASAGLGVRATVRDDIALQLEATRALGDTPVPDAGTERIIFAIRTVF